MTPWTVTLSGIFCGAVEVAVGLLLLDDRQGADLERAQLRYPAGRPNADGMFAEPAIRGDLDGRLDLASLTTSSFSTLMPGE